jgi:hypothetical protein
MGGAHRLRQLLLPAVATLAIATPAAADPAIWKVSDADSSIHLFGSVHMFTREMNWRTPQFDALLEGADKVVFEVVMDVEAYAQITQIGFTKGRLTDGSTLADLLTAEQYEQLGAAAQTLGVNMAALDGLQPWLATMTLMQSSAPNMVAGVELQLDGEIATDRKFGLETAEEQMGFLADAPLDEQISLLMSAVHGVGSNAAASIEPLVDAWLRGDADVLLETIESQMTSADQPTYDRLIRQRNERWLAPLEEMLAENADNLVVVGAAHLVGDIGVPALLEARGYTVERIDEPLSQTRPMPLVHAMGRATTRR